MTILTPAQKLDAVRQKIVEANPEIMLYSENVIQQAIGVFSETHDLSKLSLREIGYMIGIHNPHPQSIRHHLGMLKANDFQKSPRTIRLADVLLALDKYSTLPDDYLVNTKGRIIPDGSKRTRVWNLLRDSLDDQSEELIAFLYDSLCS